MNNNETRPRMPHDDGLSIPMFGFDVPVIEVEKVQQQEVQQNDEEQTTDIEIQSP